MVTRRLRSVSMMRMTSPAWTRRPTFWATVAALALASGAATVWIVTRHYSTPDTEALPPFYLEARLEAEDGSVSIGTQPAGAEPVTVHRQGDVRWLQLSRDEARLELETLEPATEAGTDLIVYDGREQWYYRHETNTYTHSPIQPVPEGVTLRVRPWSFGALIGPWFGAATTVDGFMAELRTISNDSTQVRRAGSGTILGRTVAIVEQSPISTSSSGAEETQQGVARYWVDEERMVVLRQEIDDGLAQRLTIEVTKLEWNPSRTGTITFQPPPGAQPAKTGQLSSGPIPARP